MVDAWRGDLAGRVEMARWYKKRVARQFDLSFTSIFALPFPPTYPTTFKFLSSGCAVEFLLFILFSSCFTSLKL